MTVLFSRGPSFLIEMFAPCRTCLKKPCHSPKDTASDGVKERSPWHRPPGQVYATDTAPAFPDILTPCVTICHEMLTHFKNRGAVRQDRCGAGESLVRSATEILRGVYPERVGDSHLR